MGPGGPPVGPLGRFAEPRGLVDDQRRQHEGHGRCTDDQHGLIVGRALSTSRRGGDRFWPRRAEGVIVSRVGRILGDALVVAVMATMVGTWAEVGWRQVAGRVVDRQVTRRHRITLGAALEAAEDDRLFDPSEIEATINRLIADAARGWSERLVGARASSTQWELVQVVNRPRHSEDRLVVRVHVTVAYDRSVAVGRLRWRRPGHLRLDERWVLRVRDDAWVVAGVTSDPRARLPLSAPNIPDPAADGERLTAEALAELAAGDSRLVGSGTGPGDPLAEVLDRSLVDGRYTPALLEATVSRIAEAWEIAASGDERLLRDLATDQACEALLRPESLTRGRLVVQDLTVRETRIVDTGPDQVTVAPAVRMGRRVEHDDHVGPDALTMTLRLRWTLRLRVNDLQPWELVEADDPFLAPEVHSRIGGIWAWLNGNQRRCKPADQES